VIDYLIDGDGLGSILWNNPNGTVNIKSAAAISSFINAVDLAISDTKVKGVIIGSAKRDFIVGGDIKEIYEARTPEVAISLVKGISAAFRRMERSGKPFVAALNGSAFGGGLELALACHYRVAADDPRIRLGLPEVTLGIIPGAGGTQRLPRLIGVEPAAKLLMDGQAVNVYKAKELGLVDEVVSAQRLQLAAREWAMSNPHPIQPWDKPGFRYRDFHPQSREGRWFFFNSWPKLRRKSPPEDQAPGTLLHVLAQALEREIDPGLEIEQRYFGLVASSISAKNKIRTRFMAVEAARKQTLRPKDEPHFSPTKVGVIGAGLMGGGIALTCARKGLEIVLLDTDLITATSGYDRIAKQLEISIQKGYLTQKQRIDILELIKPTSDYTSLASCDVVIEAVVESALIKRQVYRLIEAVVGPDALIASNTSTLSITDLSRDLASPENFIGLHFFAPVDRMELVEVIVGKKSSLRSHARALDLLKLLSKTAIVVKDGPGFFTSRVIAAYTREALTMLSEGVSPALIDNAAFIAGMPIGPLAMADLTSYVLLVDIIASLAKDGRGTAIDSKKALDAAKLLLKAGRSGRHYGGGVFDYVEGNKASVWSGLSEIFPLVIEQPNVNEVIQRLLHSQSIETVHAMDEGIVSDPLAIDLSSVLGWSYPAFRGGVLAHIDNIGLAEFVDQCDVLAEKHGQRFRPPPSLRQRAQSGLLFHYQSGG